ncbi:centrosome-associated protein CEP250 isoform X4 [Onychostoma macrolepis]|uniref:centrosome-associated protein CEP250 isoform X4 n=1 Tax=Onychostoma macrolepis TaxID=369639 RepID=UPI00272ABB16|nr:centrosome-associated protein CEP250 isoform X4 [Onychostoma macrolepis]XP_058622134.1 centrosome-associated protein CEP250 isoform X4 [Onychostoma macrolepis]XP_058622135.1 centrosome-associated protein CEP250 isoform X4 [Onychostoma macrolepis]
MAQSMSAKDNACRKFQANIFNKSKCQNCFKARDAHLLSDEDFTQAKPIYGGWLLLAPEGTNFDNPLHRSRKWQRRFFLLYEHGLLRYALDDMASTLPQGTINLNQCVDVVDGESRSGQKHSLCICTPEKDHYIRAESKEIIHGWQEALMVFPRTNKQNQKKKRKVETPTPQEPGPAKVTVTSTSSSSSSMVCLPSTIAHAERVPSTRATLWQEATWSRATLPTSCSTGSLSQLDSGNASVGRKPRVESGYFSLEKPKPEEDEDRQHHRQQEQEPSPPQQQQQQLSSSSTTSSSSSRSRYLSFDPELFSSPISSHKHTSHDPHSAASTQTYSIAHNACAHKHNTQRLSKSEEHVPAPDSPPSSDATLCPLPSPDRLSSPNSHANVLPSSLSSSQSSLDSEQSPEGRVGGASGRAGRGGEGYAALADVPRARRLSHRDAYRSSQKRQELRARTRSPGREEVERLFGRERSRRSQVIERFECHDTVSTPEQMDTTNSSTEPAPSYSKTANQRAGRNERRLSNQKQEFSLDSAKGQTDDVSSLAGYRRAKSLDRRATETLMTPDLLNFKKGWMTKLYEDGLWKKHWFVLTDQSLRFYRDSIAEEAADLDGEIDLSTCYDVNEFPVQRNYGFQILSKEGAFTLSAMTSGIRRNWIQAILKNMRPTVAPDVTRKNVSLKLSVLMPSSLPEERTRSNVEQNYIQPPSNSSQLSNSSVVEAKKSHEDVTDSAPPSDHRKSRVNKREGRSKTFDWSEFRPGQENESGPPSIKRADTSVIISSSSSSTSSADSSPISSSSSHQTSSSITTTSHTDKLPQQDEEVMQEYMHRNQTAPTAGAVKATTVAEPPSKLPRKVPQEQVKMDVDHARDSQEVDSQSAARRNSDVRVEIEQRWHQVETTPLREEKQVPITGSSNVPVGERALPQELTTALEKELGQAQRELARLQQQNSILQEQLQDARGREQNAREGYVRQSDTTAAKPSPDAASTSVHRAPWQRLSKLNQDLKSELDSQRRRQDKATQQVSSLRRSYSEAKDIIGHHEAEIEALEDKLTAAMADIVASEQAVARMRSELKIERVRCQEREEEWVRNETMLRSQLRESEERLRQVEASLLEKNQELRQLEQKQALQRDQHKEVQRLQERLAEATGRLISMEEAENMREERERKEQRCLEEKHERERQGLTWRLAESEERRCEIEEQLQEAQEQVEALLRGSGGMETVGLREDVHRLQQELETQTDMVEMLRESVRRLEEERDQLTCRCQELLNQIAEADREVGKQQACLTTVETDYHSLESSYERVSEEFARISHVLREKEEEVKQTKEMYEQLIRQKEQDLSEALIKMAALGSSLEETEFCLQQKEELLSKMERDYPGLVESRKAEQELQAKLVVAEDRIAELEEHLNALRLGYADLRIRRCRSQEDLLDGLKEMQHDVSSSSSTSQLLLARSSSETEMSLVKRQRIRFSTIQCQSYHRSQGADKFQTENTSLDLTQDLSLDHMHDLSLTQDISVVSDSSFQQCRDPDKFISIINALETKLLATEEKLRHLTEKIRDQPDLSAMQEHLSTSATVEDYTTKTCDELPLDEPSQKFLSKTFGEQDSEEYEKALALVECCTERVREILSNQKESSPAESLISTLAEVEKRLVCATMYLRKGSTLFESCQIFDAPDVQSMQESIKRFARMLTFEAEVLEKMGLSLQDLNSDIMSALNSIHKDAENIKKNCNGCLSVVYADVLSRKLMLETMFLAEVDKLETSKLSNSAFSQDIIKNVCISAELAYSLQNLTMNFQEKFNELQKDLLQANETLKQKDMALKDAVSASKRAHIESMTQSDTGHLGDIAPPELVPYMEQIEIEEAQSLAAEIVRRHLASGMLSHSADSESHLQTSWENLIAELKKQAKALRCLSQEIERICEEGETNSLSGLADAIQMSSWRDDSSAACLREALMQAQVAYVACRLRAGHTRELSLCQETSRNMTVLVQEHAESVAAIQRHYQSCLEKEHLSFTGTISSLQEENDMLRGELSYKLRELQEQRQNLTQLEEEFHREKEELKNRHADEMGRAKQEQITRELELMERAANSQHRLETLLLEMEDAELRHKEQIRKLEQEFQSKVQELEHANRDELRKLQECYSQTICLLEERREQVENKDEADACPMEEGDGTDQVTCRESLLRIRELEMQLSSMREELEQKPLDGDLTSLKEKYQRDLDSLKATCERGFAAMEETHQKVIEDIQRQHQREIRKLLEEKERLLEEETNATIAAIEAMKNAHREELGKTQRSQMSGVSADIQELRRQYEEELQSIHRELEVLSEQYSQKCLENAHLAQALEAERQALGQCQRENQKLHIHNQELNHRLNEEITRMHSCMSEDKLPSSLTQGKDIYELEVLLRVKESEIQYLKQEINSLKDELQSALRDKKYASDKYKDIYTELSIVKAKADCDINKLREKLLAATEALGELDAEGSGVSAGYDIMKSKSNPDFLKIEKSKQMRGVRSKAESEGLVGGS